MGPDSEPRTSLRELQPGDTPEGASWYTFAPLGERPCARVGHNCFYLPPVDSSSSKGKVVIVGGANPNGSFSDVYFIDLESGTWESPEVTGTPPSPRTFHTSSAAIGDRLYVFGGGDKGADPVQDQQLYIFDSATLTWQQPEVHGSPPAPRHGHAVVAVGSKLFIHGGLAGDTFYSDLYCIDTSDMKWELLLATGSVPGGRAAHSAAVFQSYLYIFGGMDPTGALDSMYKYHTEKGHWIQLEFKTPLPPGRLDHSMCIIPWEASSKNRDCERAAGEETNGQKESCLEEHLCLIFGGMDMRGELYKDCLVSVLQ
ncbi:rab9 effector protein with kelch motifs isoform X2 [Eublepharis macularius]|uniref:Rab9 effector protein with kelch motifs n=1 Tax=Eublepharis macularius TaxID=481883 RepID=A0AA97KEJ1_EUBMA|nr:rab9 effector protein with kelch motifs isoform X2 [Eublepharis macularius]